MDLEIMDKIREYYAGKLSVDDARAVERLMRSNEQYASHNRMFKLVNKGIREAIDAPDQSWMKKLDQTPLKEEQSTVLEIISRNEIRGQVRRVILAVSILIFLILSGYGAWVGWSRKIPPQTQAAQETPALQAEEGEEILGSAGLDILREADVWQRSPVSGKFEPTDNKRVLLIRRSMQAEASYFFQSDTLILIVGAPEKFGSSTLQWFSGSLGNETRDFLLVNQLQLFELDQNVTQQKALTPITDKNRIDLFRE